MAFESLGDKFAGIFKKMRGNATLNEKNMDDMCKDSWNFMVVNPQGL